MPRPKYTFEAFGAPWSLETGNELSASLKKTIQEQIEQFDTTYSRFRADSLVTKIAKKEGVFTFPDDSLELFSFYRQLYDATGGKVTPLIGDTISNAGYDADYSFIKKQQQLVPSWDDAMVWNGVRLTTDRPVLLDVGAAGKGYMVDIISEILHEHGIDNYVIDASGDLKHKGEFENMVGLEHPTRPGIIIGTVGVQNKSLCSSSVSRRSWGKGMHHVFDPDTLLPTNDVVATWVVAESTMVADGLATALFFTDPVHLREMFEYEYARMFTDGSVEYSSFFEGGLF
jgi:thiamine biosynthesis lipoprotein